MKLPLEYFFLLLFPMVLVLPLPLQAGSIALGLALLNILVVNTISGGWKRFAIKEIYGNSLLLFGVIVLGLDSVTNLLRNFEFELIIRDVRISFWLVPLILWLIKDQLNSLKIYLFFSLVIGVMLYILYSYGYLVHFYTNVLTNRSFEFNGFLIYDLRENLPGAYHHSYIGMYMTFSIAILLQYAKSKYKLFLICLAVFVLIHQIVLSSKFTLFFSLVVIIFYGLKIFNKALIKKTMKFFIMGFGLVLIAFLTYKSGVLNSTSFSVSNRIESWQCALQGYFEKPFFGYGHKDSILYLENCISSDAVSAHSQYLEEVMNYGIFGFWLPVLVVLLFFNSRTDRLFRFFLVLIIGLSFFENILSLQRGVLFFTFFVSVFFLSIEEIEKEPSL